jgi:hypothetical protein
MHISPGEGIYLLFQRKIGLTGPAHRTHPVIRQVIKGGARFDTVFGISNGWIINITTDITHIFHYAPHFLSICLSLFSYISNQAIAITRKSRQRETIIRVHILGFDKIFSLAQALTIATFAA